jgi:hypothetical protein
LFCTIVPFKSSHAQTFASKANAIARTISDGARHFLVASFPFDASFTQTFRVTTQRRDAHPVPTASTERRVAHVGLGINPHLTTHVHVVFRGMNFIGTKFSARGTGKFTSKTTVRWVTDTRARAAVARTAVGAGAF